MGLNLLDHAIGTYIADGDYGPRLKARSFM